MKINQWISVDDSLPEESRFVMVYGRIGSAPQICTAYYAKHYNQFQTDHICEFNFVKDVTHWMPLPDDPKTAAQKQKEFDYLSQVGSY